MSNKDKRVAIKKGNTEIKVHQHEVEPMKNSGWKELKPSAEKTKDDSKK